MRDAIAMRGRTRAQWWGGAAVALLAACGSSSAGLPDDPGVPDDGGSSDAGFVPPGADGGGPLFVTGDGASPVGDGGLITLPANFVATEHGGYALGPAISGNGSDAGVAENTGTSNCSLVVGVVRDFKNQSDDGNTGHPDFGVFSGSSPTKGLVLGPLGTDLKPVYAGICDSSSTPTELLTSCLPNGQQLTTQANFDQWYRLAAGVNKPFLVYLQFVPNAGVFTFQSDNYFPLDNAGWGNNATGEDGKQHNFGFTTELHLQFTYNGGEQFTFLGDDDVWVFIAGKLAVDLGGLHSASMGSVSLDSLGLTKGKSYPLDLFNAERKPTGSHFRADTNLAFTNCGTIPPDIPH